MGDDESREIGLTVQSNSLEKTSGCPDLGLNDDPATRATYPRPDHVCTLPSARAVSLAWQQHYCLGGRHAECVYYLNGAWPLAGGNRTAHRLRWAASIVGVGCVALVATGLYANHRDHIGSAAISPHNEPTATTVIVSAGVTTTSPPSSPTLPATVASTAIPLSPTATLAVIIATATSPPATSTAAPTRLPETTATLAPPSATPVTARVYVVKGGDTIESVAALFGVSTSELVELNHLSDPDLIITGQELLLPAGAVDSAATMLP